jgi:hypothetical protein
MIISASYKTDIPAFYGEWFMNRLRAGYCKAANPYNKRIQHVSLSPEAVDGIVFWTKNVGPFIENLSEVRRLGYSFMLQHTINSYPRALEQAVVSPSSAIENVRQISELFGPRVCVWRYDTIIDSSMTQRDHHLETFSKMAASLEGAVDEVVISFARFYRKTLRNMNIAANRNGFTWNDPSDVWKGELARELAEAAASHHIRLTVCGQPQFVSPGCDEARCVDAKRLADIAGRPVNARLKGNRNDCACFEACDIGEYDTCPHGCVYCYAVQSRSLAIRRHKQHDPAGESIFPQMNIGHGDIPV